MWHVAPESMIHCTLHDVLLVPDLAYNLLSVPAASSKGKVTSFSEMRCEIRDSESKLIASGHREGSLYYLDHRGPNHQACSSSDCNSSKETIWHRQIGHLGNQGIQTLANHCVQMRSGSLWSHHPIGRLSVTSGFSSKRLMPMEPWNDTRPDWLPKAAPRSLGSTMKRLSARLFVSNPSGPL